MNEPLQTILPVIRRHLPLLLPTNCRIPVNSTTTHFPSGIEYNMWESLMYKNKVLAIARVVCNIACLQVRGRIRRELGREN